ncbi:MAG: pyruvate kinase alpha/beta domain-containing protein [candidate division WOR-3 bacterium]
MAEVSIQTVYFEEEGKINTEKTLQIALKRAKELGIDQIGIATTGGYTALAAMKVFKGYHPIIVTHVTGFNKPNEQELPLKTRKKLEELGASVLTCVHSFGGIGRAVRRKMNTYQIDDIIAETLRVFGEGTKVCCEITLMAADAGLINTEKETIAIAGTGRGADTALVVKPANTQNFFDLKVKEILCKPRLD